MCSGGSSTSRSAEPEFDAPASLWDLCELLREERSDLLLFTGDPGRRGWIQGPLVALASEPILRLQAGAGGVARRRAVAALSRRIDGYRGRGEAEGRGVVALLAYELWGDRRGRVAGGLPALVAWRVESSARVSEDGRVRFHGVGSSDERCRWLDRWRGASGAASRRGAEVEGGSNGRPRTSLPRERYLAAVERLRGRIAEGEIYQANLCQQFRVGYRGDPLLFHRRVAGSHPSAHGAYVEAPGFALASASPETFLRVERPGRVETWPIKGTRPRGQSPDADRAAARELASSEKDRAELVMIVDLERNDLGRVCRGGSVSFGGIELRSLPTVHHLVARVEGVLREGVGASKLIGATFPGGSITGAPKSRAMELLREVEPVERGYFTGSLFWFGDDGRVDSSILIRTAVFAGGQATIGAGGGIVADSDPESEWRESNHKARFLTEALGFRPEEAV